MDTPLDERQSLELIREMINRGKRNFRSRSIYYLVWGWAALIAGLSQYTLLVVAKLQYHWVTWPIFMILAGITVMIIGVREGKRQNYITFTDRAMKYLWGGFGIYILVLLLFSVHIGWAASYTLIIGLYGLATFISGGLLHFRPMIVGGLASLILALVSIFLPETFNTFSNILLLLCTSLVVSYLIPGYMLRAQDHEHVA